jgi:hypothetical protein
MAVVVLLIVLAVIAFLLYQSVQDARRRAEAGGAPARPEPRRAPPKPKPRPKPRPRKVKVDEKALAEHVAKLRDAIANDLISTEEAVASIVRQTDGAIGEEAARKLLAQGPSAA